MLAGSEGAERRARPSSPNTHPSGMVSHGFRHLRESGAKGALRRRNPHHAHSNDPTSATMVRIVRLVVSFSTERNLTKPTWRFPATTLIACYVLLA